MLRVPAAGWPGPANRAFRHLNQTVYVRMQGPTELDISAEAALREGDRLDDLAAIRVPTLVIGAGHDTMDPAHMQEMAQNFDPT